MEGHCWKVPPYRKAKILFLFFFTEQGGTQSWVREEGGWLKGTSLLFQNFLNLHDHSWLIKTKIWASFWSPPEKQPNTFMEPPVQCQCCGLIEESKSMELMISEETRQDTLQIKTYKRQPSMANKNRPLQLCSGWMFIYWRRERYNREKGESCQDVIGVKQIGYLEWQLWLCRAGRPAVGSGTREHLRHGLRAPISILNWITGFSAVESYSKFLREMVW